MSEDQLVIKFGGDGNIKVETLTEFLNLYKDVIYIINEQLGHHAEDLVIEVSPPENGSFKITISPRYKNAILKSLNTIITTTLSAVLIYYMTNPTKDQKSTEANEPTINSPGTQNVYNIYQNTGAKQKINQTFVLINDDKNITNLKIEQGDREVINVPRSEFKKVILHEEDIEIQNEIKQDVLVDEATLIIKTIHFEGHAKWAFIYRGYPIKAIIKDVDFISKNEAFRRGDTLRVSLSRIRHYDNELETYIVDTNTYAIEKVIEHKSKTTGNPDQSSFDLD
jgi:hypothetical protein